jgi:hypothetical protein
VVVGERYCLLPSGVAPTEVSIQVGVLDQLSPLLGAVFPVQELDDGGVIEEPEVMVGQLGCDLIGDIEDADVLASFDIPLVAPDELPLGVEGSRAG